MRCSAAALWAGDGRTIRYLTEWLSRFGADANRNGCLVRHGLGLVGPARRADLSAFRDAVAEQRLWRISCPIAFLNSHLEKLLVCLLISVPVN